MRFTVQGSKIVCSRIDRSMAGDARYRQVVEFDAQLDAIPPHVTAKLTHGELRKLEAFLADRRRIAANPTEVNMLEALPDLIGEANEILGSANRLNKAIYQRLSRAVNRLVDTLDKVRPREDGLETPVTNMRRSEALKARLESVHRGLAAHRKPNRREEDRHAAF